MTEYEIYPGEHQILNTNDLKYQFKIFDMEKRKNYKKAAQEFLGMMSVTKSEDKEVVLDKLLRSIGRYQWNTYHDNQVIGKFFIEQLKLETLAVVLFDNGMAIQDGNKSEANRMLMSFLRQLKQESTKKT